MRIAQANIRAFAKRQLPHEWTLHLRRPGVTTGQIVRPPRVRRLLRSRRPLSSALHAPHDGHARAGRRRRRIVVCSPKPARETLAAAHLAGVTEFYRIGGAQAIAALAYGTETIPRVDKIVGPGNLYVTAAKLASRTRCGIDMPAGPTEIVVTSETGDPAGIAADLVAQAEHDPETLAILITTNADARRSGRRSKSSRRQPPIEIAPALHRARMAAYS